MTDTVRGKYRHLILLHILCSNFRATKATQMLRRYAVVHKELTARDVI